MGPPMPSVLSQTKCMGGTPMLRGGRSSGTAGEVLAEVFLEGEDAGSGPGLLDGGGDLVVALHELGEGGMLARAGGDGDVLVVCVGAHQVADLVGRGLDDELHVRLGGIAEPQCIAGWRI